MQSLCIYFLFLFIYKKRNINYSLAHKIPTLEKHPTVVEMDEEFILVVD